LKKHTLVSVSKSPNCPRPSDSCNFDNLWKPHEFLCFIQISWETIILPHLWVQFVKIMTRFFSHFSENLSIYVSQDISTPIVDFVYACVYKLSVIQETTAEGGAILFWSCFHISYSYLHSMHDVIKLNMIFSYQHCVMISLNIIFFQNSLLKRHNDFTVGY
jgi:hypothetical protein